MQFDLSLVSYSLCIDIKYIKENGIWNTVHAAPFWEFLCTFRQAGINIQPHVGFSWEQMGQINEMDSHESKRAKYMQS